MYEEVVIDRNMKVNFKPGQVHDKGDFSVSDTGGSGETKSQIHLHISCFVDISISSLSPLGKTSLVCHKNLVTLPPTSLL